MLLAVRLYWGFQFAQTGWGKLHHLSKITAFFASLNIPFPGFNAPFISTLEFAGGILFMLGLFSRPIALLLAGNMFVAYWTADHEALVSIFSDPGKFYVADPYTFLFASLMVLIFGAGLYSVDTLIARYLKGRSTGCPGCGVPQNDKMDLQSSSLAGPIGVSR
jgi:putative oxidoreductase